MQFSPPDDEHMCSKHVEAWNKLILKQKFSALSWVITEINVQFYFKNKSEKSVHLVGFIIRIYHDTRSPERQIRRLIFRKTAATGTGTV